MGWKRGGRGFEVRGGGGHVGRLGKGFDQGKKGRGFKHLRKEGMGWASKNEPDDGEGEGGENK